ncbi:hypothetical protein HBI70_043150 [Parastagonospora nodorum]|nr:hypothetical protein HBH92_033120 [Parastagonospora nodorum]KAH4452318.1 hypothetical protein HBH93_030610 [Parastagonospora nodorum]KAH4466230.1 hypothetical protein HBH91_033140 [Parastagonospora nodorum]KAH4517898.1 hypothetical protein HBH89_009920 [Parastagonospora nodorum]KAH4553164.1 hypothetical protein HBH85_025540 [Parastagonospora nodorum]
MTRYRPLHSPHYRFNFLYFSKLGTWVMESPCAVQARSSFAGNIRSSTPPHHATRSVSRRKQANERLIAGSPKRRTRKVMASDKVIDKRGDVLLELMTNGKRVGSLLVSSHVLSLASPVFEAMFNGNFAEGQVLSAALPKSVALPDDDPDAVTLFCKITHMKVANATDTISISRLADLAILCDKYQCTEAVSSWARVEIAQKLSYPDAPAFEKLLFITYVLDLPLEFGQVSSRLTYDRIITISYQTATHSTDLMPLEMIDQIRYKQIGLIDSSRQILFSEKYQSLVTSGCDRAGAALKHYLASLKASDIPMDRALSVAEYARCALNLQRRVDTASCLDHADCAVKNAKGLNQEVAAALIAAHEDIKACCLDCMRKNMCALPDLVCRLGHPSTPSTGSSLGGNRQSF